MKYENQQQCEAIDKARFVIECWQNETMACSEDEFNEALELAKTCMTFAIKSIVSKDKSLKEIYQELSTN